MIQYNSKVIVLGLLIVSFSLLSCTLEVSTHENILNLHELRNEISNRYNNLEVALKASDEILISPMTFKKESLKYLLEVDESADNYEQISINYDSGFNSVSSTRLEKGTIEDHKYLPYINSLSERIIIVDDFKSIKLIFEDFYSEVFTSKNLDTEDKNLLISIAAWYEGTLNFFDENQNLFLSQDQDQFIAAAHLKGCGWWQKWGKCVAGTLGGYYGGALAGCAVGGGVGATAAGVGAVPGCAVGAAVGAIGGALTGAASSCDGCETN